MKTNGTTPIPQGYQASPLGIIPQEWEVKRLGDITNVFSGTTPSRENELFFKGGVIPWVKTTDLNNGNLTDTEERITDLALRSTTLKVFPKGTILIAMYGGFNQIGRVAVLGIDATINQALSALILNKAKIAEYFLLNWLLFRVNKWKRYAASSRKDPNITKTDVLKFPILVPPLAEQKKIAEVLGVWDKAIEKQTQLIKKLELRKKGLMQQLLTGKKRLPGFNGEWRKVAFSSVIEKISNGYVYDVNSIGSVPITRIETISKGFIDYTKVGYVQYVEELEKYKLRKGDILFSHINSIAHIGKVAIFKSDKELYHGMNLLLIRAKESMNKNYLYYFLSSTIARKKVRSFAKQAVNQASVNTDELKKWTIYIPEVAEQNSIAEVLTAADREIELAQQKFELLRQQKSGLMQQLLTGKKRVKI